MIKKSRREPFEPERTILDMKLKEARAEVKAKQTEISVAIQKYLPRDINEINNILEYRKRNCDQIKDLPIEKQNIIKKLDEIEKMIEIMLRSKAARILAVQRVITNKGYKSSGINLNKSDHPKTNDGYVELVEWLREPISNPNKYQTCPLDRIYLLKTNKTNKYPLVEKPSKELGDTLSKEKYLRPISIPSIKDRCLQSLYYLGYVVYSEYVAESNSYAFRPARSPAWAAMSIAISLRSVVNYTWALEVDIAKCFDNINHEFIINHTPFIPKVILTKWLKQGYILRNYEFLGPFQTHSGIPQGGIISPTICNTVLDGAEAYIREHLWNDFENGIFNSKQAGYSTYFRGKRLEKLFKLYRYADDIVILTKSKLIAELCKQHLSSFLAIRGLSLSEEKTKITDISGGTANFDFIGYTFRKNFCLGPNKTKWFIDVPQNSINRIKQKLRTLCHSKTSIAKLFYDFSTLLRSWVGYYVTCNITKLLSNLNLWVYKIFYYALERRVRLTKELRLKHCKNKVNGKRKKVGKIGRKYLNRLIHQKFIKEISYHGNLKMKWYTTTLVKTRKLGKDKAYRLFSPRIFKLIRQNDKPLTKQGLNFYNDKDRKTITEININYKFGMKKEILSKNLKKYNGEPTCPCCLESFYSIGKYEFHHKFPVEFGGKTVENNVIPLCIQCHREITRTVNSRSNGVYDYIQRGLLDIPNAYLYEFTQ